MSIGRMWSIVECLDVWVTSDSDLREKRERKRGGVVDRLQCKKGSSSSRRGSLNSNRNINVAMRFSRSKIAMLGNDMVQWKMRLID